jgi:hypothetical protein
MGLNTYVALYTTTLASPAASIVFNSISQNYTDLVLVSRIIGGTGGNDCLVRLNSDTGTNYSNTVLYGSGSSNALSTRGVNVTYLAGNITSIETGEVNNMVMSFNNYSNTVTHKTCLTRHNSTHSGKYVTASAGLWRNTNAITSIEINTNNNGTWAAGTSISLYGIVAAGANPTPKATGGVISTDSLYYYHTFPSSGTFTPSQALTCDYFIVAGGGGAGATVGGGWSGGGGGAGGYRSFNSVSFASGTAYTATIGAGGNGGSGSGGTGSNGSTTSLIGGAISSSSSGGGGGGTSKENGNTQTNGAAGGSGGGAPQNTVNVNGGAGNSGGYTPVEGYAGFSNTTGGFAGTGQGGGAGGIGIAGTYLLEYPFNGVVAFDGNRYANGGGARWLTADVMTGDQATGNGGYSKNDGTGTNYTGGKGGSGTVVIRYLKA